MEKVKLPREVAEAIESLKQSCAYPIRAVMDIIYSQDYAGEQFAIKNYCESDRSRRIGYIVSALVNGCEVEETPEDKVRNKYISRHGDYSSSNIGYLQGIIFTLNTLNIEIEGVNA
ncbi:hypothetical protein [Paenibacillus spongiae]|uniref:Uncharacterized protein n=1 Tax=Paenibacillus spongiae TaxID=2909671 RepID=A0ABY5SB73_9BACL|nr:hypothetical protein [Paenibacillus spongiae]UVI31181.1 hypothetical protein L1F29_04885 [Paenibacillus spongiae]